METYQANRTRYEAWGKGLSWKKSSRISRNASAVGQKKDPNAPKATYNLSTRERARRAATKRVNAAKKRAAKSSKAAEDKRRYARKLEQTTAKVEKALVGNESATIDLGDLDVLPDAVGDLVGESEIVFQPNDGPQTDFLSRG